MRIGFVRVHLRMLSPWAIAAPESSQSSEHDDGPIHLPVARSPFGEIHIPASSLAGALRAHLRVELGEDAIEQWMGSANADVEGAGSSRIRIPGVMLESGSAETPSPFDRLQTAIDPARGVARSKSLRRSEVLESGSMIVVLLRIDGLVEEGVDAELLRALTTWRPIIGRGASVGMGTSSVHRIAHGTIDLDRTEDLAMYLGTGGAALWDVAATQVIEIDTVEVGESVLAFRFRSEDAIFLGGGSVQGNESSSRRAPDGGDVFHGSALKGILRSRAGFILRTLGESACSAQDGCGLDGCRLCAVFGSSSSGAIIRVPDARLEVSERRTRTHVAIDRVSGGAMPERLFVEKDLPFRARFEIRVESLLPAGTSLPEWVEILLAWVMLDLHDGFVGLGGRTSRGLGSVCIDDDADLGTVRELASRDLVASIRSYEEVLT